MSDTRYAAPLPGDKIGIARIVWILRDDQLGIAAGPLIPGAALSQHREAAMLHQAGVVKILSIGEVIAGTKDHPSGSFNDIGHWASSAGHRRPLTI
jgi:hypothetical protein